MKADKPRTVVPDTRLIETPKGMLTIELSLLQGQLWAHLKLYGLDGWLVDERSWSEELGGLRYGDRMGLAEFISELTGMPAEEAEAVVPETVAQWRGSSAYNDAIRLNRSAKRAMGVVVAVALVTVIGVAAIIWLIVSALT